MGLVFLNSLSSTLIGGAGRDAEYIAKHTSCRADQNDRSSPDAPAEARRT
jgi:hypothetical protein